MTRMCGYKQYECPVCQDITFFAAYGSINPSLVLPTDVVSEFRCKSCGHVASFEDVRFVGFLKEGDGTLDPKYSIPAFLRK